MSESSDKVKVTGPFPAMNNGRSGWRVCVKDGTAVHYPFYKLEAEAISAARGLRRGLRSAGKLAR